MDAWKQTTRKVPYPRAVSDALMDQCGIDVLDMQEIISECLIQTSKTPEQERMLRTHLSIKKQCEMAIAEDVAQNPQGSIFLLKSQHGYEDKQTLKVEDGNLAAIVQEHSKHNAT